MGARLKRSEGQAPSRADIEAGLREEGLDPHGWANEPGYEYGWHEHGYTKVLYCVSGSIVFHTHTDGDLDLRPGDRLEVDSGTEHAATVGDQGVECVEAPRR